ncbi:MAG: AEC family transporter [Lachnospiraceae bacterium]|jgi:predicted permease|nr:AEC family transporter [Lachnospiraceae bacterium]
MSLAITLFNQIVKMFLMMAVGYVLYRNKTINDDTTAKLSSILLMVATPCTLITSFNQEYSGEKLQGLLIAFVLSALVYGFNILAAGLLCKKEDRVGRFCVIFSNAGFIGIPLVTGLYGIESVFYLSPFIVCFYLFVWTVGVSLMSGSKDAVTFRKIITNPCIWAVFIGVIVFLLPVRLPLAVMEAVSMLGGLNTPLAMIVLGAYLAKTNLLDMFANKKAYYVSFCRLVLLPVLVMLAFKMLPSGYHRIGMIVLTGAAAPVGALAPVFAQMFHRDTNEGAQIVSLSTILCIVTMPVLIMVAEAI